MRSNGKSSAGPGDLLNKFSARREMTDNRKLIWFAGVGCNRLLRFAGHRLRNRRPRRWRFENLASSAKKLWQRERRTIFRTRRPERSLRVRSLALVRIFDGSLLYIRRQQIWVRAFRVCGRSLDGRACGADSLLDFLFSRCQRVV